MTSYQASPIKRARRSKAQVEQLERQIFEVLQADHPQSIRHVFYRMTDPRLPEPVEKSDAGYNQVQHRVTRMRRNGDLRYSWISDMSRTGFHTDTYDDATDFLRGIDGLYRQNLWQSAPCYCEVWCESRSIASVVRDDCRNLAVSLYPCGGFSSITLAHEAALAIDHYTGRGTVPAEIIYIGDHDPAGVLIDVSLERELRQHIAPEVELNFHRIAITPEQIIEYDLPTKPRKAGDRRALHIRETVEAEAMPAGVMRQLLRDTVETFLPADSLRVAKVAEESERELLFTLADELGETA